MIPKYYMLDPNTILYQLYVPKNYGHAFISLEDDSTLLYHFDDIFDSNNTQHIHYLDPSLGLTTVLSSYINIDNMIISDKDNIYNFIMYLNP